MKCVFMTRLHPRGSWRAYARLRESANEYSWFCAIIQAQAPSVTHYVRATFLSEGGFLTDILCVFFLLRYVDNVFVLFCFPIQKTSCSRYFYSTTRGFFIQCPFLPGIFIMLVFPYLMGACIRVFATRRLPDARLTSKLDDFCVGNKNRFSRYTRKPEREARVAAPDNPDKAIPTSV